MTRALADTVAADRLPALVAALADTDDQVKITHDGVFAAMLVSPQKWRSIVETLDVIADPEAVADLEEADAQAAAGGGMDVEDVAALVAFRPIRGTTLCSPWRVSDHLEVIASDRLICISRSDAEPMSTVSDSQRRRA